VAAWLPASAEFIVAYHELGLDKKTPLIANYTGGFIDPWNPLFVVGKGQPEAAAAYEGAAGPFSYSYDSTAPAWLEYVEGMTSANNGKKPQDGATNCTVQAGEMFLTAVEATGGDTTPNVLRDALLATDITGPEGPQFFASGGQCATRTIYIMELHQGDTVSSWNYTTVKTYKDVPPTGYTAQ